MVVDTSALLAILQLEDEAEAFARRLEGAEARRVSTVSVLEAGIIVASRKGTAGEQELDTFLQQADLTIHAFDAEQVALARDASARFGKGRHAAALNLGDCASYALAKLFGEPLLFKGNDFGQTDVMSAMADHLPPADERGE
jgi:ribonuclease VapC